MSESILNIKLALENEEPVSVPYTSTTTAEDVCILICKQLNIGPLARHLFALRVSGKGVFLCCNATFKGKSNNLDFRIRFKVADMAKLKKLDINAYNYYLLQARTDVRDNKIPDIVYKEHKGQLLGLCISDMSRVIVEKGISRESIENEYKKYVPKLLLKNHPLFLIKIPIHTDLVKLEKSEVERKKMGEAPTDPSFYKLAYINQLDSIAPEYPSETYKAMTDLEGYPVPVIVKITPPHMREPGIKYCVESKKGDWTIICTIEELGYISANVNDTAIEIHKTNEIPIYLKFHSIYVMWSFISLLDGYYRLTCKWTFNICKELDMPSLRKLKHMKCHGPVGGEFSYAKLESKTSNKFGCFIIRESEENYNSYYIDVCVKESSKPKTFKLDRLKEGEFVFHEDVARYKNIQELVNAHSDPEGAIFLNECIPSSEYDISPLLLCRSDNVLRDALTDRESLAQLITKQPVLINYKDLQMYKDRKSTGPWCYTMNPDLMDESCSIPLCSYSECRLTGPGMEYGGSLSKAVSDRKCLKWNKERKKVLVNGNYTKYGKFSEHNFPDLSLSKANKFCRNPDGDIGGPWCFVDNDELGYVEREYCDIPFCFDPECSVFTKNHDTYMHYTDFNGSALTDIKFGIKLWNSDNYHEASARLVLSVLALPLTGKEISDLGIGIEIFISNHESTLRFGNKDTPEYEPTPGILTSTNYTTFTLNWDRGFITFGVEGRVKPIFLAEIKIKNNLIGYRKDRFDFYAVQGTDVMWSFPFCLDDDECDVHTTTGAEFQQFWPLRQKDIVFDLYVHIRAYHSAAILITPSPTIDYPCFKIVFLGPNRYTRVTIKEYAGASEAVLKEIQLEDIVDYWKWNQFSISFFANSLHIYMKKAIGMHSLLEAKNEIFRTLRWFSVSSENTVAHWSFFCQPPHFAQPPMALLPECAINTNEPDYTGTQDITSAGLPCLPWSGKKMIPNDMTTLFKNESSILSSRNYCRDPALRAEGTFCYALTQKPIKTVRKEFCQLRKCKSQQCKMAGTGNDFIGHVTVTRSGRTCDSWDVFPGTVHKDYMYVYNGSYFAEMNSKDAKNFCRNPNRDISGSWCYTTDPLVVQDVCGVIDCDRPEEMIVIVSTNQKGRRVYILPQWKEEGIHGGLRFSLKEWNPDLLSGLVFSITSKDGNFELSFIIGANLNERVELYFNGALVESKTYPHLISAGKWTDFWLQTRKGEMMFGFQGVPTPLFEWRQNDMFAPFEPMFIAYYSIYDTMPIGVFFQQDECHTENTTDNNFLKFLPIGLYSEQENIVHTNLTLKMRGYGHSWIALMWVTNNLNSYQIKIDTVQGIIGLYKVEAPPRGTKALISPLLEREVPHIMATNNWTKFYLTWSERVFDIKRNDELILHHESDKPNLFYWFSVASALGWVTWSANCEPLDLDGPPVDGGWSEWSPWTCTVSCGGGEGFRTRTCSNPHPNIFGKLCEGNPTATGVCNEFPCGDLSPDTLEKIRENLRKKAYSFIVDEDQPITLTNDRNVLKIVKKESPEAYFEWTLNGVFVNTDNRVSFQGDDIIITKAKPSDAGIYVSMIYRVNNHRVILKVLALAVRARKFNVDTRATRSYTLQCHSVILGYVYADLSMKLVLNNKTYLDHGRTTLAAVDAHALLPLNESNTGHWQCVVEQKDLKLKWVSNYVKLNVKKKPNFYTHLMEDKLTAPFFGLFRSEEAVLVAVVCVVLGVFLAVVGVLFVYLKFCTLRSRYYKRNRRLK